VSKFIVVDLIDEPVDQQLTTGKDTNLEAIRVRFVKVGAPVGTMKLQILDAPKTTVVAESTALKCDYSQEADYVGIDALANMSWIKFSFGGQALRSVTTYHARLLMDATYIAGRDTSNYLMAVVDYPKPTNDNGVTSIEATQGRNFSKYPRLVLQVFGRDYGELT
jgi:hypothetical protein